jgi:hypothetical protein
LISPGHILPGALRGCIASFSNVVGKGPAIAVIGDKVGLDPAIEVSAAEAREFAAKDKAEYRVTPAFTGQGIAEVFVAIA